MSQGGTCWAPCSLRSATWQRRGSAPSRPRTREKLATMRGCYESDPNNMWIKRSHVLRLMLSCVSIPWIAGAEHPRGKHHHSARDNKIWDDEIPVTGYKVVGRYEHDQRSFTQGLEFDGEDTMLEGTGLYGKSLLRRLRYKDSKLARLLPSCRLAVSLNH